MLLATGQTGAKGATRKFPMETGGQVVLGDNEHVVEMQPARNEVGASLSNSRDSRERPAALIHATLENGTTMLFDPREKISVCNWISDDGEYFDNPIDGAAEDVIEPGVYVLERQPGAAYYDDGVFRALSTAKIKTVRKL